MSYINFFWAKVLLRTEVGGRHDPDRRVVTLMGYICNGQIVDELLDTSSRSTAEPTLADKAHLASPNASVSELRKKPLDRMEAQNTADDQCKVSIHKTFTDEK